MVRSGSESLADTLTVERPAAEASSTPPDLSDTAPKHRSSVPIKRNQRLYLELPVLVYSLSTGKEPEALLEVARSLVVYPGGGVLGLGATVKLGQELLLVNPQNKVQAECRVAGFESKKDGPQSIVRLEFTQRVPRFWGVVFPPEKVDPAERKLPRLPRRSRRVESSQPIQVRQAGETACEVTDVCITQNISRDGLYFTSGQLSYREGMRLAISFLRHSDLFALNTGYTAQIVRVDTLEDGRVGVAVRLVGNNKPRPPVAPTLSRSDVLIKGIGHDLAAAPGHFCRSLRDSGIRIVRWPAPHFGRIRQSAAKQANALVCLWTTLAKPCMNRLEAWGESTAGLVRSACLASAALAISLGKATGVQFVKLSCKARGHLEKYLCNLAAAVIRVKRRSDVLIKGIGHGLPVVSGHLCRSLRDTGIGIVRWPMPHFGRRRQSAAKEANALVCLGTTLAKLCMNRLEAWRESTAGVVRSTCLASVAAGISLGVQFVKLSCEARGHLEKYLCNLTTK